MTSDQETGCARHDLECARRIRLRLLLEAGEPAEPPVRLLHEIADEVHAHCDHTRIKAHGLAWGWTVAEAVAAFHEMCKAQHLGARGLSGRSWMEWESGERPNADYQNLLCRLFQTGPVQLGFAADYTPHGSELQERTDEVSRSYAQDDSMTEQQRQEGEREVVTTDAHEAALFARKVAGSNVNDITLEQLDADVRRLAQDYVSQPLNGLFLEIRTLRSEVFAP